MKQLALALLLTAASAFAADVDGKWSGSFTTPQGEMQISFNLKADGEKLTGKMEITGLSPSDIKEGKVAGDKVNFAAEIEFGANIIPLSFTGVLAGEELKLNVDAMGRSSEMIVKKEK